MKDEGRQEGRSVIELEDNWLIDPATNRLGHECNKYAHPHIPNEPIWWFVLRGDNPFCTQCHEIPPGYIIGYYKLYCWSMEERNIQV